MRACSRDKSLLAVLPLYVSLKAYKYRIHLETSIAQSSL